MKKCLVCENPIAPFMSFGKQPLGNGFLTANQFSKEYFFEMAVCFCERCSMLQLADQPKPEQMFNDSYAFFSGTSKFMAEHFKKFAESVRSQYLTEKDPFVVEIGSNDGIMLKHFKEWHIRHLGVEPSANVAEVAKKAGIKTICKFFGEATAKEIVKENGKADAYLAANVMCHIGDIHSVIKGIDALLKPTGIASFEDPYLGDVLEKTSYDQIYDEHVFLFSATSLQYLFGMHGFELIQCDPQTTHGGSMRYTFARKGARPVTPSVAATLKKEKALGISEPKTYAKFKAQCERSKKQLMDLLQKLKKENKRIVGYAATSKSTTVINYCGITPDLVDFISDTTPLKQGKYSPGMHIPVEGHDSFKANYPDFALLFGWNHKNEILGKEKEFMDKGGKWIVYVPDVTVL